MDYAYAQAYMEFTLVVNALSMVFLEKRLYRHSYHDSGKLNNQNTVPRYLDKDKELLPASRLKPVSCKPSIS